MVNKLVPDDKLMDETLKFANLLAKRSPIALSLAKMAINNGLGTDLHATQEFEAYMQGLCIQSNDSTEAVMAFLEKREAKFSGS